jgi:hypothetical protein
MKNIIASGVLYQPFGSFSAVSQSDDGIIWDEPTQPFPTNEAPTSVSTDGVSIVVSNSIGQLAVSEDLQNFSITTIDPDLAIASVAHQNGEWLVIGNKKCVTQYGPYPAGSEISQLYKSTEVYGDWLMVWTNPNHQSRTYQMKWIDNGPINGSTVSDLWIMCGSKDNNSGDAWYSLDNGNSWKQIVIPDGVKRILSVELVNLDGEIYWYWGSNGRLYRSLSLEDLDWREISVNENDAIVDLMFNEDVMVICGQNRLYSTNDGVYLKVQEYPGYVFDRLARLTVNGNDRWLAFARSGLTQYTQWSSDDLTTWTPSNNSIHVTDYVITGFN